MIMLRNDKYYYTTKLTFMIRREVPVIKRGSKQSKVSRIDRSKALAAQADEALKERIRTAPAYMYTSLCPVPELREPPKGVIVRGIKTCVL